MIGTGLKKLAKEHNMKVSNGVAYGSLCGYAATFSEGSGYKRIVLTTRIGSEERSKLHGLIDQRNIKKEFRVNQLEISQTSVDIVFLDNPGTMKKIYAFLEWFLPLLGECGATKTDVCVECGNPLSGGVWKLINGTACFIHDECAQRLLHEAQNEKDEQGDNGSYLSGLLGALVGAALGAIGWAALLNFGYVASIMGLLIGFLALKGYELLGGKQSRGKTLILLFAIVAGVVLGTFGGYTWQLLAMIRSGELPGLSWRDLPMMYSILLADGEFVSAAMNDVLVGLLFAALGSFGILVKTGKQIAGFKMIDLE